MQAVSTFWRNACGQSDNLLARLRAQSVTCSLCSLTLICVPSCNAGLFYKWSQIPQSVLVLTMASRRRSQGASSNTRRLKQGHSCPPAFQRSVKTDQNHSEDNRTIECSETNTLPTSTSKPAFEPARATQRTHASGSGLRSR